MALSWTLTYDEMMKLWHGLCCLHDLGGMAERASFQHESIRETLMQFYPLFAGGQDAGPAILVAVQVLTILSCMTFKAQMDGADPDDSCKLSVWVEAADIIPPPGDRTPEKFRQEMREWSTAKIEHIWSMISCSKKELATLLTEVPEACTQVIDILKKAHSALDSISIVVQEETAN